MTDTDKTTPFHKHFWSKALWSNKESASRTPKHNHLQMSSKPTVDPERTAFIHTLESVSTFIAAMDTDFRTGNLDHTDQSALVNVRFEVMLDQAANAGDVGLMISHRARGLQESLNDLDAAVQDKVEGHVDFSPQACADIGLLFKQTATFLKASSDYLVTDSQVLLKWLDDKQKECAKLCEEFATRHQERLTGGICSQDASMLYLDILHSFKGIQSQVTNIVWLLAGLCGIYDIKRGME